MANTKSINVKLDYSDQHFRWQMFFTAFTIEKTEGGRIVRFSYTAQDGTASNVVPIFLSEDGLKHFRASAGAYLAKLEAPSEPRLNANIPETKVFSPHYANNLRAAYAGEIGEIAFYLIVHHSIADMKSQDAVGGRESVKANPIALFHSVKKLHVELITELLTP